MEKLQVVPFVQVIYQQQRMQVCVHNVVEYGTMVSAHHNGRVSNKKPLIWVVFLLDEMVC